MWILKNETKKSLPSQYSMSFSGRHDEVVYILLSINIRDSKDMDSGHYVCDVFYYNLGTWCIYDDDTIINYSGYPDNVYDDLSL